jgi:hypothetical protein
MPIPENGAEPASAPTPETEGAPLSRRSVLRGAAGAGAAGLAMTAFAGPALAAVRPARSAAKPAAEPAGSRAGSAADTEDVVVHVRNLRTGEMDVYHGTSHVRVTDRELAVRLAKAAS